MTHYQLHFQGSKKRPKIEVPTFCGNLNLKELIYWIKAIEEYFEFEEVEDTKKVRFAKTNLKVHASIWWKEIQIERGMRGKKKITR